MVESVLDPVDDGLWVRLRGSIGGLGAGICQIFPLVSGSDGASLAQGVQRLGALAHPSIAPVLGSGRGAAGDFFYIVWGDSSGVSLKERRRLSFSETMDVVRQVGSCLAVTHEQGLAHQQLRQEHIFIAPGGAVRLQGFIGFSVERGPTSGDAWLHAVRTDVYDLGIVLCAALASDPAAGAQVPPEAPENGIQGCDPGSGYSARLRGVVKKATAEDPGARYQSMPSFLKALEGIAGEGGPVKSDPTPRPAKPVERLEWRKKEAGGSSAALGKGCGLLPLWLALGVALAVLVATLGFGNLSIQDMITGAQNWWSGAPPVVESDLGEGETASPKSEAARIFRPESETTLLDDVRLTIHEVVVKEWDQPGVFDHLVPSDHYAVALEVSVYNGRETVVSLQDALDLRTQPTHHVQRHKLCETSLGQPFLETDSLARRERVRGWLCFEVPVAHNALFIRFRPGWEGEIHPVLVALGKAP